MVKPLSFKGDKKTKKRKTRHDHDDPNDEARGSKAVALGTDAVTTAESAEPTEDDSWVTADVPSDITGPVIIVLPSSLPACIASDAIGKVFASTLENLIEGDPGTAEPHDVRQVWVATRVAGLEGVCFKGHHGRSVVNASITPIFC